MLVCRVLIQILDDGDLWNHSKNPNTGSSEEDPDSTYALRDIAKGEQLLDDYSIYDFPKWFVAMCSKVGVVPYDKSWDE